MEENKDLVTTGTTAVSTEVNQGRRGFEDVDMSEVTIPVVKLMQQMSPELEDPDVTARAGELVHTLFMEKVPFEFIPLKLWKSQVMFAPRDNAKRLELMAKLGLSDDGTTKIICKASNAKTVDTSLIGRTSCMDCPYSKWEGDTPPACTSSQNVLAIFGDSETPAVYRFANTNKKYGDKFRDMTVYTPGDIFAKRYKLVPRTDKNDKGTFWISPVKPAGKVEGAEFDKALDMYNTFSKLTIKYEDVDDDMYAGGEE
jgi:hypothetical protein